MQAKRAAGGERSSAKHGTHSKRCYTAEICASKGFSCFAAVHAFGTKTNNVPLTAPDLEYSSNRTETLVPR